MHSRPFSPSSAESELEGTRNWCVSISLSLIRAQASGASERMMGCEMTAVTSSWKKHISP